MTPGNGHGQNDERCEKMRARGVPNHIADESLSDQERVKRLIFWCRGLPKCKQQVKYAS